MRFSVLSLALACLLAPLTAAAPPDPRAEAFRRRPLAEKLATPRQTLETLCFALDAYETIPAMIADAVACLEITPEDGYAPGTPELLAIQMNDILDELSLPFTGVGGGKDRKPVVFYDHAEVRIVLTCTEVEGDRKGEKVPVWRFSRDTVARIPAMRLAMANRTKQLNAARAQLRGGMEEPTATMTTFLDLALAGDFDSAAARLDLSHLPAHDRQAQGPELAWKLAGIMQRRGYVFRQAVPLDPDGPPFTWSADATGRITVERIRQPGGKDTWLFSRATVEAIPAMWDKVRDQPIDPRYLLLGKVVPPLPTNGDRRHAPAHVPEAQASPRTMLRTFFRLLDEAEFNDAKLREALAFCDLRHLSEEDADTTGRKLAPMLEAVLRKIRPDLSAIPDKWSAGPQVLTGADGLRVEIVRQADGCWRFSGDTMARLPAMYEKISGREKSEHERSHGLNNPRETLITFFRAVNRRDSARAAQCLDLSELPVSARDDLGPVLAFKLKSVIDHEVGRVYLQEYSNDPDGPQVVLHRGEHGRIVLARRHDDASKSWRFTAGTVAQVEAMYSAILDRPVDADLAGVANIRLGPDFWQEPGVWILTRMPERLRRPVLGLAAYQWAGLVLAAAAAWLLAVIGQRLVFAVLRWGFPAGAAPAEHAYLRRRFGGLRAVLLLLALYYLLEWVDLPSAIAAPMFAVEKFLLTAALVWAGFQATDLGYLFYQHSRKLDAHRGLGDLVIPFISRLIKLGVVLVALAFLVYQFGEGDSLKQFLAGVGVAGLAVSLAAQDSLKNLFATLLLIGDRTFRVGDRLLIGDKEGVVEQVGFRSTKLRTPDDSLLILPNSVLAYGAIDNLGLRQYRRIRTTFVAALDTPPAKLTELTEALRKYLTAHPGTDHSRVHVHLNRIADGGLEVEATAYFEAKDLEAEKQCRAELTAEILRLAGSLGVVLTAGKK